MRDALLHLLRFLSAFISIGLAGVAGGYFGAALLGLDGTAAPLNMFFSGPIGFAIGAGVGIFAMLGRWSLPRCASVAGVAAASAFSIGLLFNWFG